MKRSELEHLIRAAGRIAGERELVVIGSQAILGQKIIRLRNELDESAYLLELLREAGLVRESAANTLVAESNEPISIFSSVVRQAKAR